ncbi:hypothetical protein QCA50_014635 [Cerrena zonata]|uniref:Uncharacterized protein n=1 Tax=Cerrena zonata TaxID=2478898 RepID=A0AAW0FUB2_9APHY
MPPLPSFPSTNAPDAPYQTAPIDGSAGDEYLRLTNDIRQEIEVIEAEGKHLLDAFNGLKLSTLVKEERDPGAPTVSSDDRLCAGSGSSRMDIGLRSIRLILTGTHQSNSGRSSAVPE